MADQHAAHMLGCAGATHVRTPALDAFAATGTRFTRAYTTFPLCVPARASMMTGRYPHELGLRGNNGASQEPAQQRESLGYVLREHGYDTAYAGKWHACQPSATPNDGFDVVAPFGDRGLAAAASSWLRGRAVQERPFALVVSFDDPHSICEYARNQPMPYGPVDAPPPVRDLPPLPANHSPAAYESQALRYEQTRAAAIYGTCDFGPDDWRQYRHAYAQLVERADANLGAVLTTLEEAGLADETVVIYTSDHGDGDASHAWNQKTALFEESCRVPLIVRDPRGSLEHRESSALVSVGLDVLPTLVFVAQSNVSPTSGAADLGPAHDSGRLTAGIDFLDGARSRGELVVETEFQSPVGGGTTGRALVTDRYKYVVYGWGTNREQLFDLEDDPGEMRNLAAESAFDDLLERLRRRLLDWCLDTQDTRFLKRLVLPLQTRHEVHDLIFAIPY